MPPCSTTPIVKSRVWLPLQASGEETDSEENEKFRYKSDSRKKSEEKSDEFSAEEVKCYNSDKDCEKWAILGRCFNNSDYQRYIRKVASSQAFKRSK